MNRKTFTSIITISVILVVSFGALTALVYLPQRKTKDDAQIKGAKTTNVLEASIDYLANQVVGLKDVERNLLRAKSVLAADSSQIENQLTWSTNSRLEFLSLKAKSQSWDIPDGASDAQALYQQMLDQYILMYQSYINAFNQQAGQDTQAQFSLVEAERADARGDELLNQLKTANGEILQNAGSTFTDTDGDKLPDVWEQVAGTDFTLVDTDEDGITDAEEFNLYLTKPTVPDTDSDGFIDGVEVANGFNPLGEGLLIIH
ncbi:MAG: hypothetical protein PHI73_00630 [Patescibacteria group bacterium]|nr:hypothetical protein [Patescibacteria group bacterium]